MPQFRDINNEYHARIACFVFNFSRVKNRCVQFANTALFFSSYFVFPGNNNVVIKTTINTEMILPANVNYFMLKKRHNMHKI